MALITIRLDPALKARLDAYCHANDRSASNTARIALKRFLEQEEAK